MPKLPINPGDLKIYADGCNVVAEDLRNGKRVILNTLPNSREALIMARHIAEEVNKENYVVRM